MRRLFNIRVFVWGGVASFILFFIYLMMTGHTSDTDIWKNYMFLFKDSIKQDIDTVNISYRDKNDIYNCFTYTPKSAGKDLMSVNLDPDRYPFFNIVVWEFKHLTELRLSDIKICQDVNLDSIELQNGEVLSANSDMPVSIIQGYSFHKISVNLNNRSVLKRKLKGSNYMGFYGVISKLSFENETGKTQIIVNSIPEQLVVFLFYKNNQSLFMLVITGNKPFDEKILNILNLN